jgi:hypothetical protein
MRREHAQPARAARKGTFAQHRTKERAGFARARSPRSGVQRLGSDPQGQTPRRRPKRDQKVFAFSGGLPDANESVSERRT